MRPRESANGRLAALSQEGSLDVDVEIEADPATGTCQWFCFGLRALPGSLVRIVNAGACTYPGGWTSSVIWTRSQGTSWMPCDVAYEAGIASFTHGTLGSRAEYALFPPYPSARLTQLAQQCRGRPDCEITEEDDSIGRALRFTIGDRDASARQIWVIGGQHGAEHPALWFMDGFLRALLTRKRLMKGVRFHIVPIANPQGMRAGHLRTNAAGQDPNRFWAVPRSCPEVFSLHEAMARTGVDTLLDVHTDFEMGCVYLDVLDEWMETSPVLVAKREAFERRLAAVSTDVEFGKRYPWKAPPDAGLLTGMCAPAVERRFGATAMTLELPIGRYSTADGEQNIWTPRHSSTLGRQAAVILTDDDCTIETSSSKK